MFEEQLSWLLIEGVTPLFGAGIIFGLWGIGKWVVTERGKFSYSWKEAIDSMGWLYVALILSVQAAGRYFGAVNPDKKLGIACIVGSVFCLIILLSAMDQRGQNEKWYPPNSMRLVSLILAIAILAIGWRARGLPQVPELPSATLQIQHPQQPVEVK